MPVFYIYSKKSAILLGAYSAANADEAAREMRRDAGYDTDEKAAKALGVAPESLNDDLRIEEGAPDEPGQTSGWVW